MNYITLFSKHTHSLCKLGSLHTTVKLVHPSSLHSILTGAVVSVDIVVLTQRSNANFQNLRIWTLTADICWSAFKKKSRSEISDYNTHSKVKLGRCKTTYFWRTRLDVHGWVIWGGANIETESRTFARLSLNLRLQQKPEKCFFLWKTVVFEKRHILRGRSHSGVLQSVLKLATVHKPGPSVF